MSTPITWIRRAFDRHLQTLMPQINLDWQDDIAWPNIEFKPPVDRPYLRPTMLLDPTFSASCGLDGFDRLSGIYQISVFDITNIGMARAEVFAARLVERFRAGTILDCTVVEARITSAYSGTAVPDDNRLHIPVSVVWYSYFQRGIITRREIPALS